MARTDEDTQKRLTPGTPSYDPWDSGDPRQSELDQQLDEALQETFPASDPIAVYLR